MYDFVFILPLPSRVPVGGYKVIYEYSNRLVQRGYKVAIFFYPGKLKSILRLLKSLASIIKHKMQLTVRPSWFDLDKRVDTKFLFDSRLVSNTYKAKNYVATAWQTADIALQLSRKFDAQGIYLVQDYEEWSGSPIDIDATFSIGLKNIAISRWLQNLILGKGNNCHYIPNGLDFDDFYVNDDIELRNGEAILGMYHKLAKKGSKDIIDAYKEIHKKYKNAKFTLFSVYEKPEEIPEWIDYIHLPDKAELLKIYNEAAIFVTASYYEGWGLPACEAMQCGCALVASKVAGHMEFAEDGKNSLVFEPGDVRALVKKIEYLLEEPSLRISLARHGSESIKSFSWQKSVDKFIAITSGGKI